MKKNGPKSPWIKLFFIGFGFLILCRFIKNNGVRVQKSYFIPFWKNKYTLLWMIKVFNFNILLEKIHDWAIVL